MFFLLLNVVFGTSFSLIIKWLQNRDREDIITVGAVNYIIAAIWILPEFLQTEVRGDVTSAVVTGGIMGTCYFVAYFFINTAIRLLGVASTTVVGVLSILLPVGCGIFVWHEEPHLQQIVGAVLALAALALISNKSAKERTPAEAESTAQQTPSESQSIGWWRPFVLITFFFLAGFSRLSQEAFKHESVPEHRPVFLMTAFAIAAAASIGLLLARRKRVTLGEIWFGFLMGASNILQSQFMLLALKDLDGFVAFPVSSACGLLLTAAVATGLLGEKLDSRKLSGIGLAVVALVLLNSQPGP